MITFTYRSFGKTVESWSSPLGNMLTLRAAPLAPGAVTHPGVSPP